MSTSLKVGLAEEAELGNGGMEVEEEEEEEEDTLGGAVEINMYCGGGGGSYNVGKNQQNECCYNNAGHGQVTITLL